MSSAAQTKTTTTNVQTPEEDNVQETIPSMYMIEDFEKTVLSSTCFAYDCVRTELNRTSATTISTVPESMELDPRSKTPTNNRRVKEHAR